MMTDPKATVVSGENSVVPYPAWSGVKAALESAEMYWITSLQDGIPHTTPVIGVWWEGALYSCNPRKEQKYKNLKQNPVCQALTGCSRLSEGLDIVVHGRVEEMRGMEDRLRYGRQMAEKYPEPWRFEGTEMDFWVYRLVPSHIRVWHRSHPVSYTRWDFASGDAS